MKNKIIIGLVIFLLFIKVDANAQWIKDSTSALPRNVNSTYMINKDIRFAIIDQYVYKTTNGGKSWKKDFLFAKSDFVTIYSQKIDFINNTKAFIQSQMTGISNLYTSKDTGKTWTKIPLKTQIKDCKILFLSESKWMAYDSKSIEITSDGGQTWQTLNRNNSDTIIYHVEVIENKEIILLTGNHDTIVNVNLSLNFGGNWEKIAGLDFFLDSVIKLYYFNTHSITKSTKGYLILSYFNCNCFDSIRDYSCLYFVYKENNNWKTVKNKYWFTFESSQVFILDDTLHITYHSTINKLDNFSDNWYPVLRLIPNTSGESFSGFHYINNTLYASTSWGNFYKNAHPNSSKNLSSKSKNIIPQSLAFPNPAKDYLTFRFKDKGIISISIYDVVGKQLFFKEYNNQEEIIVNTDYLPSGNYYYSIVKEKGSEKAKFSIVK